MMSSVEAFHGSFAPKVISIIYTFSQLPIRKFIHVTLPVEQHEEVFDFFVS